mmetsp:Transcript_123965/g.246832  ORF Transcript_123965/g.246832 Transcript_123965/m.246832 type:complete len:81 (-) Transcript_123965:596-838(-)
MHETDQSLATAGTTGASHCNSEHNLLSATFATTEVQNWHTKVMQDLKVSVGITTTAAMFGFCKPQQLRDIFKRHVFIHQR